LILSVSEMRSKKFLESGVPHLKSRPVLVRITSEELKEVAFPMKPPKTPLTHNPFRNLKVLLEAKSISLPDGRVFELGKTKDESLDPEVEERLFSDAMKDVAPISREGLREQVFEIRQREPRVPADSRKHKEEDEETLSKLQELINNGSGFEIFDTSEYVEGTGYRVHPELAKRLHRGDFSIQAHLDLHGLTVPEAKAAFERFLKGSVQTGKSGVLIIHGRGLSSPVAPVLKTKVMEWLSRGSWRKWVIAYASARSCDGGAGGTYILLRKHPAGKKKPPRKI
jgi:DNA-nicking Smr family endonuclease